MPLLFCLTCLFLAFVGEKDAMNMRGISCVCFYIYKCAIWIRAHEWFVLKILTNFWIGRLIKKVMKHLFWSTSYWAHFSVMVVIFRVCKKTCVCRYIATLEGDVQLISQEGIVRAFQNLSNLEFSEHSVTFLCNFNFTKVPV